MDLFGDALLSFHRGQSDAPLKLTRDDGWEDTHSPGLYFEPEPFAFERDALALLDGPTLDVGCGAGRHLKWFAAQGLDAHGVDISEGAIQVCRERGLQNVGVFDVMSGNPPNLSFRPTNICLFGNNVGIGGSFDGSATLFRNLRRISPECGHLVLTGLDIRQTDNPRHIAYQENNLAAGRRRGEMKLRVSYEERTGAEFPWYHPEPHEIEELAALTGWQVQRLERCGNFFWSSLRRS
ncbi:methyltransferase family protein [Litoreibacter ponti]|uniref:Methyltransferase family protein n=1 Tax=Litoreibacter ponti TaxID=1510457 RepID=A0A2T6BMJ6_9RHOB|nr:class I SAM-dependent methyltransferase [Litoreibacter ponti]PTX57308.1 methyltransferase family protein [Litoreibacter ponti]